MIVFTNIRRAFVELFLAFLLVGQYVTMIVGGCVMDSLFPRDVHLKRQFVHVPIVFYYV